MNHLVEKVNEYVCSNHMIEDGQKIIIGVSGGADSMGLLLVLCELASLHRLSLAVVHVNHGVRGKEADEDQAYVENICKAREIPCYSFHLDLKRFAKKEGMSQEEAGRYYRYQCFEKVRRELHAHRIAVAHQREDACETVLFNLFRGTGIKGLAGIPPVRDVIIRPMLCCGREEIEAYLSEQKILWRTDATNLTDAYARNKIRNHILPYVEANINPAAGQHIIETAGLLKDISEYMDRQGELAFEQCAVLVSSSECRIRGSVFGEIDPVIQREVVRRAIGVMAGQLKDIEREHVEMVRGLMEKQVGRRYHLPYQLQAIRTYEGMAIKCEAAEPQKTEQGVRVDVKVPGAVELPGPGWKWSFL